MIGKTYRYVGRNKDLRAAANGGDPLVVVVANIDGTKDVVIKCLQKLKTPGSQFFRASTKNLVSV